MAELVALVPSDAVTLIQHDDGITGKPLPFIDIDDAGAYDAALPALREATGNCPMCILAALSQAGYPFLARTFEFKKELAAFWSAKNEAELADGGHRGNMCW